jgi:ribose transport system ATP-binding protein
MNETAAPGTGAYMALRGVSKRYGGVTALDGVDFACARGTIHAVLARTAPASRR